MRAKWSLYVFYPPPSSLTLSEDMRGSWSDSDCWLRLHQTKRPNSLTSFASVKVTIERGKVSQIQGNARTRSWHGTMKSGDMYGYLSERSIGCAPLSLSSAPAVLHLRG